MNLRKLTALLLILLTALHSTSALAARYVTNGAYTAYAGVDEYLYLMEPDGSAKRLKADNLDILAMDETKLYYVTGDNVYSIVLKASQVAMELKDADEDALMTYRFKGLYTLGEDGVLYLGDEEVASGVLCASANSSTLYYITEEGPTLWGVSLSGGDPKEYSLKLKNPQALAAADSHLLVLDDGDATGYSAAKMKKDKTIKLPKGEATDMFLTGKTLNLYITDEEEGESLQTVNVSFIKNSGTTVAQKNTKTKEEPETEPEDEPEEEVYEEAEDEPEQEEPKKASSQASANDDEDFKIIQRGVKGSRVKEVQKRLKELGYSVGTVDGEYGSRSIRATRAFQTAAGLEADGRVDQDTWDALFSEDAPKNPD